MRQQHREGGGRCGRFRSDGNSPPSTLSVPAHKALSHPFPHRSLCSSKRQQGSCYLPLPVKKMQCRGVTCSRSHSKVTTEQGNSSHSGRSTSLAGTQAQAHPCCALGRATSSELDRFYLQNWVITTWAVKADNRCAGPRPNQANQLLFPSASV